MKRLLFVCVENAGRSQMAEALARIHGGDSVAAFSAGSRPSGRINPEVVAVMAERDYDLSGHRSKGLDELPGGEFDAVITMGCGDACPWVPAKLREDWDLDDPKDLDREGVRRVRNDIERRVVDLLSTLAQSLEG